MRHIVDFRNTSDTGEIDAAAIIPYNDGEAANQTTFRRPVENTRSRTEVLRTHMREHILMRDIDRNGPGLWGGGTITFNGTVAGGGDGKFTTVSSLYVVPMITPGDGVGSTAPYVASSKAYLTVGTLGNNQVIIESVKKQFEGSDMAKADANRLSVEILNDTAESIALEGATGDVNNIKITIISGTTTAQDLVDLINNDVTVTQYVTASLEATSTGTNFASLWGPTEWGSDFSQRFLKGGYPGIVHEIPFGNINSFFSASSENCLQKGDTLALSYDDIIDYGGTGGVLQSTPENGNTIMGPGSLFNTRREPEKCANAIAICKCIDNDTLLFIDGSYIKKGVPASLYFDSGSVTNAALLGAIDTSGWVRLDIAPGAHTPPTNIQESLNNTDDLFDAIMTEIEAARNSTVYGAQSSMDARMEAADVEINNARNSSVYGAKASLDLRLEDGDTEINAGRTSTIFGAKSSLVQRLEAGDTHSRAFITCTDGTLTTGGMYNGPTAFQDAVQAAITAGRGERILVRKGNYTWTGQLIFNLPMQILGIEGVTVTLSQASGYALTFQYASVGRTSFIRGIQFTGSTKQCINITGNDTVVEDCSFTTVGVGVRLDGERNLVRGCHFQTDDAEAVLVRDTCVGSRIADCTFTHTIATVPAVRFYGGGSIEPSNVMENCSIICSGESTNPVSAIWVDTGFQHTTLRNIYIECNPVADSTTAVVYIANGPTYIENMVIRVPDAVSPIRRPMFRAYTTEGVFITNLKVDMGGNWLEYNDPEKCPVALLHRAHARGMWVTNCKVPTASGHGTVIQYYNPIVRLTGGSSVEDVEVIHFRMDSIYWDGTYSDGTVTLVGGKGSTDISAYGYSTDGVGFVLRDFYIDAGQLAAASPTFGKVCAISNIPNGTVIDSGKIILGNLTAAIYIIGCGDNAGHGATVRNVTLDGYTIATSDMWSGIHVERAAGGVAKRSERIIIEGNKVLLRDNSGNTRGISLSGGATSYRNLQIVCCNNIVEEGYTSGTMNGISVSYTDGMTIFGNVIRLNGSGSHVFDGGNNLNIVPAIASAGSYNVYK